MLRISLLILCLCCSFNVAAQDIDKSYIPELPYDDNNRVNYTEVVPISDVNKEQLYFRAKAWFSNVFKDSKEVIQMDSKEAGTIIGKGNQNIYLQILGMPSEVRCHFTVKIFCKDARYKYEITNISFSGWSEGQRWEKEVEVMCSDKSVYKKNGKVRSIPLQYMQQTEKACKDIADSIKAKMQEEIGGGNGDDW